MEIFKFGVKTLPEIGFAHSYSSKGYNAEIPVWDNYMEITYVVEGNVNVTIKGKTEEIKKGSVMVNNYKHKAIVSSNGMQSHVTVGFKVEYSDDGELVLPSHFVVDDGEKYRLKIEEIIKEFAIQGKTTVSLASMLLSLMTDISDEYKFQIAKEDFRYSEIRYVERVKVYIVEHIKEKFYTENAAAEVGLSVGYLSNLFKRITGQTMVEYFNKTKLRLVKELMDSRDVTLKTAAKFYGFTDVSYVSRLYRKYFNATISGRK